MQLIQYASKDDYQKQRPWPSTQRAILTRQSSNVESNSHADEPISPSKDRIARGGHIVTRSNRALSVEPNLMAGGHAMRMDYGHDQFGQKSLPNRFTSQYESNETIEQSL